MKRDETPNDDAQRRARRLKAAQLRATGGPEGKGLSFRQIAEATGVDVHTAWDDVMSHYGAMQKLGARELESARDRDLVLIDICLSALAERCELGDEEAIKTADKLINTRAKILPGLAAPTKVETKQTPAELETEEQLWAKVAELQKRKDEQKERQH